MTSAAVDLPLGLPEGQLDQVDHGRPAGEAEKQGSHRADVQVVVRPGRIHEVTVLSVIAAVQFAWLAALGYGLWLLL